MGAPGRVGGIRPNSSGIRGFLSRPVAAAPQGGGEPSGSSAASGAAADGNTGFRGKPDMSFGGMPGSWGGSSSAGISMQNLIWYGVCFVVLLGALLFAVLYRRRPR